MSRTAGISGSNAATLTSNNSNAQWAGSSDGSYNGANGTRPLKGAVYTFKIYNDGALVATETRTLLTDLVAATQEVNMPWNSIGPNTTAALDVNNSALSGTQTSLKIDWIQNSSAEQIKNVWISQTDGSYDNSTSFKLGATSVNAVPNGTNATFTSLTGTPSYNSAPYGGYREIGFSYRMLDGSTKNAVYTYYP
jgi:hypothetical protein